MQTVLAQVFGILALCVSIACFQMNSQKKILVMQLISSMLFMANLALLGAMSGALLNLHGIARSLVYCCRGKYKWADSPAVVWVFSVLAAVCVAVTYKTPWDILPLVGTVFTTISFYCTDPAKIRLFTLPSPPCWFTYHMVSGSIGGMLNEIFVICSIGIAMFRYRKKKEVTE